MIFRRLALFSHQRSLFQRRLLSEEAPKVVEEKSETFRDFVGFLILSIVSGGCKSL
jgi:hypothetical protein